MSTPSPAEKLNREITSLQTRLGQLQTSARLANTLDHLENVETTTKGLAARINSLRTQGYAFEKDLETRADALLKQWGSLYPTVKAQTNAQAANLQTSLRPLEAQMTQLGGLKNNLNAAAPVVASLGTNLKTLEDKVAAAERTVRGMYDKYNSDLNALTYQLGQVEWMMKQLGEASFQLLPSESGIMAVKAVWCKEVKERDDDPQGVLYLTDQRLLFEQKQEVATKKVLFIATEKQKVQDLKWELPVALLTDIKTSKQGMMKNEDHLDLFFGPGAAHQMVHVHIWQPVETWQSLLNKAKAREFDQTRAIQIDPSIAEKTKTIPAQCPSCGGHLPQTVLRGQDSLKCEFCGLVIRL